MSRDRIEQGRFLLVRLQNLLNICCEGTTPRPPTVGYHAQHITNSLGGGSRVAPPSHNWDNHGSLLATWMRPPPPPVIIPSLPDPGHYITDLPTTTLGPLDNISNDISQDLYVEESNPVSSFLAPSPVLIPSPVTSSSAELSSAIRPILHNVTEITNNESLRFLDAIRAAFNMDPPPQNLPTLSFDSEVGVDVAVAGGPLNQVMDVGDPVHLMAYPPQQEQDEGISPILQICAVLAVLVAVMVVLFHSHHFRRDCMLERRALRRISRRYQVSSKHDVESSNVEENTDVTDVYM